MGRLSNSNQVSSVGASCPPSHGYPMGAINCEQHILQAFLKDANHNSLIFCKPSWAGRLSCAVMALVLSVSWPINEKVNQSIKLVINRSITKKISESQGISWNLCLLWLLWLELGGFFMGVRMRIPHDPPTFSGQKKAPTRLCFWPSVDVETGNPLRGMGHESPGCPTSG